MADDEVAAYALSGFPQAALRLQRALDHNRARIAADEGVSPMELRALFRIAAEPGITPKRLAERLALTSGAVTGVSTRLVAASLIHRVEHPEDRRSIQLELTSHGVAVMDRIHEEFLAMVGAATTTTDAHDLAVTTEVLGRIADRILEALDQYPDHGDGSVHVA
ncbi:MarR family winged helix-turn-helix transcriptional regulator [Herbiconiux sp. P15]|uniref:MarR family winged helix-turn-helix transcriptional regulator n=1 Tax=Herbiconiux liukaitaii TaxID=3342799 RepID=UPI0035B94F69